MVLIMKVQIVTFDRILNIEIDVNDEKEFFEMVKKFDKRYDEVQYGD